MSDNQYFSPVQLSGVRISYGGVVAVERADIDIASGEFFTLLGPSGCGKTTLLRTIAGFNRQSMGTIKIGDGIVDDLPAHKRNTGMVFQNYAIFPHLNVRENVAYGLRSRGVTTEELEQRVTEALAMVDLSGYDARMPKQLSGGQQQRVVIARAIVIRPRVLLMDEPLANLDAKLRVRLREDLRALQQRLGITTIYVTHDQEEALSISDRIAVMSRGRVLQVGTPEEIYAQPNCVEVARFVGEGTFLPAELTSAGGQQVTLSDGRTLRIGANDYAAGQVLIGMRPQDFTLAGTAAEGAFSGRVSARGYFGPFIQLHVDAGLQEPILARVSVSEQSRNLKQGDAVHLAIDPAHIVAFKPEGAQHD